MQYLAIPFVWVLEQLNKLFDQYAVTILVFTILVNLCFIPLTIKQQKSTAKQAKLRPKLEALKAKCGDDKMKFQQAQQELYQRENVSMMGGCLPMIIRMVLLMGVYAAIRSMIFAQDSAGNITMNIKPAIAGSPAYSLFGLDLSQTPQFSTDFAKVFSSGEWLLWLIPILSGVAALVSSMISMAQQKHTNPQAAEMGGGMKGMMLIMPLFSIWIAFSVPAAVGLYWIYSNLVNMIIMLVVNAIYSPAKIVAKDTVVGGFKRRQAERAKMAATKSSNDNATEA